MKKILVTGGAGYIGSHTIVELSEAGYDPIIIDDFRNSDKIVLEKLEQLIEKTIIYYDLDCNKESNLKKVFSEHNIEGVIHFAAYKAVGESVEKPLIYYDNNVGSLVKLMSVMNEFSVEALVFSSSCTVYGEPIDSIVSEESPLQEPESPYGRTKLICEKIIQETVNSGSSSVRSMILRYFNPIGAHESALIGELPIGYPNNLVPYITQSASGKRGKLSVFGNDYKTPDGTCIRDFIHVCDLASAHVEALNKLFCSNDVKIDIYNIGTGSGTSVLELIQKFESVNNIKLDWEFSERRAGDIEKIYANSSKVKNSLNWTCKYSVDDALKHAWNWEKSLK